MINSSSVRALGNETPSRGAFAGAKPQTCTHTESIPLRGFCFSASERALAQQMGLHGPHSENTGRFTPERKPRSLFSEGLHKTAGTGVIQASGRLNRSLQGLWALAGSGLITLWVTYG